jgi:hypothetical protein
MGPRRARTLASRLILLLSVVVFVGIRVPYLSVPLERDEGDYAYIAQRILEGDAPYRDVFDQKPPGIYIAYLAGFALFGQTIESIHLLLYLWTGLSALALFGLVRRLAGDLGASLSVLIFSLASADARLFATAANTEQFMLLPMIASAYALVRGLDGHGKNGKVWWLLSGGLAAWACWFKPVAATHVLFVAAAAAVDAAARRRGSRAVSLFRSYGLLAVGAVAASLPLVIFLVARGSWDAFVDSVLLHNLRYASTVSMPQAAEMLSGRLAYHAPTFAVVWALAGATLLFSRIAPPRVRALLAGWLVASFAGVSIGFYYRPHYFIQALPALCALAGIAAGVIVQKCLDRPGRALALTGVAGVLFAIVAPPVYANRSILFAGTPADVSRQIYGMLPFHESIEIADYIRRNSGPDDSVFVVGSEPQILFYARRRSATRYVYLYPLQESYEEPLGRQREAVGQVKEAKPLYILWGGAISTQRNLAPGSETFIFDWTLETLRRDYQVVAVGRPVRDRDPGRYVFSYGDEARARAERAAKPPDQLPWIILYRRVP